MRNCRSSSVSARSYNVALRVALGVGLVSAGVMVSAKASAQASPSFPFPSSNTSALSTTVLTSHELRAQYAAWKATFLEDCKDGSIRLQYPENPGADTRSEGVGYGMVIAAYMGDQQTFDGLWSYWQRFDDNGLMRWRTTSCQTGSDTGSASDADVDAALALIVADRQWGGYAADAASVISAIRTREFLSCNGRNLLDPGSDGNFGNCGCMNPSYFAPAYYAAFAQYDTAAPAGFWTGAATAAYATLADVQTDQTGLVPAWSSAAQVAIGNCTFQVAGGGNPNEYQSDAARTPWRVATDLAWTNSAAARGFLTPMVNWLQTANRITHIVDRYALNGSALPQDAGSTAPLNNMTLSADGRRSTITMGAFATAAIAGDQNALDRFVGAWQSLYIAGDRLGAMGAAQAHAFNSSLALLYGLVATGTMWNPLGDDPVLKQEPAVADQPGNQLENGDFDEGILGWTFVNISDPATPGTPAEGFAMHQAGQMHIVVERAAARAEDPWEVRLSQPVTVQAGQNYLISVKASAETVRPFSINIEGPEPVGVIGSLGNRRGEGPVMIGPELQTYDWVFASTASGAFNFNIDVANSDVTVVLDDIVFQQTTQPVSSPGDLPPAPVTPGDPAAPGGTSGTPPTGGGEIGAVTPGGGDVTGIPGSQSVGGDLNGSSPPAPTTRPGAGGSGTCTTDASCDDDPAVVRVGGDYKCSLQLGLCYVPETGYVWSPAQNDWTKPPFGVAGCAKDQVFWPKYSECYVPDTGYIYNSVKKEWQYFGDNYTEGKDPVDGCSVSGMPTGRNSSGWWAVGLLGTAFGLAYRRRS
jgi:MYXO-CTERM domain-containing protein